LSSVIFVIGGNSAVLKNHNTDRGIAYHWSFTLVHMMMPFSFRNLYKIATSVVEAATGNHWEFFDG